jgi:ABC-type transport system involved in cytochrome c biogenesis permease subunit
LLVLGIGVLCLAPNFFKSYAAGDDTFDLNSYAALPAQDGGRFKPMDTVARMTLMIISGKQTFVDDKGEQQPAIKWILDVMTCKDSQENVRAVLEYKVFRIDNDQVLSLLGLEPRRGFRYALKEFMSKEKEVVEHAKRVRAMDPKNRDLFDKKIAELDGHLGLFYALAEKATPRVVIPTSGDKEEWFPLGEFLPPAGSIEQLQATPTAFIHYHLLKLYAEKKEPKLFNQFVIEARKYIDKDLPRDATATGFELFYNHFEAFFFSMWFYVGALVLGLLSWLGWSKPLNRAAILLMLIAVALNLFGFVARMYIQNRPLVMVTNLYSSAIFIGMGCAVFCLFVEFIFPRSIALVAGSAVAAGTGFIAHNLSLSGDTMEMMQAVLDTNFWLATHVTCVTLGYTATFLAGFLGILYIILGLFTTVLEKGGSTIVAKMIYGVVCFATLLSFTGTVLGGIWADQSWGRFWGWDPKENGALLIVIWNALILHARWGGLVKQRGMAQLAIGGNIVTSWSWFGTNMLGVGLHSYGFMSAALIWLLVFAVSQLLVIGLGWIPLTYWMSFQKPTSLSAGPPRGPGPRPVISTAS